jgi:hypothetical protein
MDITLSEQSKRSIEKKLNVSYEELISMDADKQREKVESKIGKRLTFQPTTDNRFRSMIRGSMLLFFNKFFEFDSNKMDKRLDLIAKRKFKLI